jgi:hypothetical protein
MTKQTAIKVRVEIGTDRMVRLPVEVPAGPAELIVLVTEQESGTLPVVLNPIGLFREDSALLDDLMEHVRAGREESRMRDLP